MTWPDLVTHRPKMSEAFLILSVLMQVTECTRVVESDGGMFDQKSIANVQSDCAFNVPVKIEMPQQCNLLQFRKNVKATVK